jgi:hypothetical protein
MIAAVSPSRKSNLRVTSQMSLLPSKSEERKSVATRMWRTSPSPPPFPPPLSIQPTYQPTAPCPASPRSPASRAPRRAHTAAEPRSAPAPASPRRTRTERQVYPRLHQDALGRGASAARRGWRAERRAPAPPVVRASCAWGWVPGLSARAQGDRGAHGAQVQARRGRRVHARVGVIGALRCVFCVSEEC